MASSVEELSINFMEEDQLVCKELDKVILSKGAWATVLYKYQDWDRKNEAYGPTKFTIRRYQKRNNIYTQKSKFNISSVDQAQKIIGALQVWLQAEEAVKIEK